MKETEELKIVGITTNKEKLPLFREMLIEKGYPLTFKNLTPRVIVIRIETTKSEYEEVIQICKDVDEIYKTQNNGTR